MAKATQKNNSSEELVQLIIHSLSEKKAKDIVSLDLRDIGVAVADYFIIAHGDSNTQVNALHQTVLKDAREAGYRSFHDEGKQNGEWIIIDYVDVVVHIFHREKRDFYQLEELWHDAVFTSHDPDKKATSTKEVGTKTKTTVKKKGPKKLIDDIPFEDDEPVVKRVWQGKKTVAAKPATEKVVKKATVKPSAKKAVVKKAATKEPIAEEVPAKKIATKKAVAKKSVKEEAPTKKIVAKKAVAKKPTTPKK